MHRYTKLGGDPCPDTRTCPSVNLRDDGKVFAIVGRVLSPEESADLGVGPGEIAVELPVEIVNRGMDAYRSSAR